jgi:hypothetical protein
MAVTMKHVVFWDVTPCESCTNRRFGGTYHVYHHGDKNSFSSLHVYLPRRAGYFLQVRVR